MLLGGIGGIVGIAVVGVGGVLLVYVFGLYIVLIYIVGFVVVLIFLGWVLIGSSVVVGGIVVWW